MRLNSRIKRIKAREILDSRGEPTIEVSLLTNNGIFLSSVPSGASTGKYEAVELRDGGKRYQGKGVLNAVNNVNKIIAPRIRGKGVSSLKEIDELMINLDGTENKSRLGANAILSVSMAVCRAEAAAKNLPLYRYIGQIFKNESRDFQLPLPCFNIINGGAHAGNKLDIQEFMIVPRLGTFKDSLKAGSEIYHNLKNILKEKIGDSATNIGDEGGFAPKIQKTRDALNLIKSAIKVSGYSTKTKIALDCAASQFAIKGKGSLAYGIDSKRLKSAELLGFYKKIIKDYPIISLEDPFEEDDFESFKKAYSNLGKKVLIIGDDLLATNINRIKAAKSNKLCNGLLLKLNQIGTVSEALEAAKLAESYGWKIMVSHRSGETNDSFIADLAVGICADFIKTGAPARGERVAKYNRLLEIEDELRNKT